MKPLVKNATHDGLRVTQGRTLVLFFTPRDKKETGYFSGLGFWFDEKSRASTAQLVS